MEVHLTLDSVGVGGARAAWYAVADDRPGCVEAFPCRALPRHYWLSSRVLTCAGFQAAP